ncbi:MAG TPA: EamA family transporter [Acidimicrobiia bacterium]
MTSRLDRVPPEPFFAIGAISQYAGAAIAVVLFEYVAAGTVALLRVVGAAMIIVVARRSWSRPWSRETLGAAAVFGTVLALMNLSFYLAIDRLPLGNAVAVEFLGPVAVAAVGARSVRTASGLGLAAIGVAVLVGVTPEGSAAGFGFALLAGVFWAGYIVVGHRVAMSGAGVDGLGVGMAVGALVIAPFTAGGLGALGTRPLLILAALATGLLSNAIPYGIDQAVLARIDRARFALLQSLLPLTATVVGFAVLAQRPTVSELVGIALVAVAIVLARE